MLTLHPRVVASAVDAEDHYESCACYCVVVFCVSFLLFIVLAAAVSISRACAIAGAVVLLVGLIGWLTPTGNVAGPPTQQQRQAAPAAPGVHHRCACGLADAAIATLPTFAYQPPAAGKGDGSDGDDKPRGSCVLCAVCLEDVRAGEMVRQLPACRHLFHVDCVDTWLRAHRTCPLCRCQLSPGTVNTKAAAIAESSVDALPPV